MGVTYRGGPAAAGLSEEWREVLKKTLDPELAAHIVNVLHKPREIVFFTESAAWCTRLRLAMRQLEAAARARDAAIVRVQVRVLPAGAGR